MRLRRPGSPLCRLLVAGSGMLTVLVGPAFTRASATDSNMSSEVATQDVTVDPPPGSVLDWSPVNVVVEFPDVPERVDVVLRDAAGNVLPPVHAPQLDGKVLRFPSPQLYAGSYEVSWSGTFEGSSSFQIAAIARAQSVEPLLDPSSPGTASSAPVAVPKESRESPVLWMLAGTSLVAAAVLLVRARGRKTPAVLGALVLAAVGVLPLAATFARDPAASGDRSSCLGALAQERIDCLTAVAFDAYGSAGVDGVLAELEGLSIDDRFVSEYGEHVCHTVAHQVGQDVVAVTGSIRKALREGSMRRSMLAGDTTCAGGYLHGALEGGASLVTTDVFASEMQGLCGTDSDEVALDCAHGVGHGAAIRLNSRLLEASDICLLLGSEPQRVQCILGVSMLSGLWIANVASRSDSLPASTPAGVPAGHVGEPCLDPRFSVTAERFAACLQGMLFYMKAGTQTLDRLPAPWSSVEGVAAWCTDVTVGSDELTDACFAGVGAAAALRVERRPEDLAAVCGLATSLSAERSCVVSLVTQAWFNQAEPPPAAVFEAICSGVRPESRAVCRETVASLGASTDR